MKMNEKKKRIKQIRNKVSEQKQKRINLIMNLSKKKLYIIRN